MSDKTLGQIAYEAFHADPLVPAELIRHWYSQARHEHTCWQAAAEAVVDRAVREWIRLQWATKATEVQQAVIEAARALAKNPPKEYWSQVDDVLGAVEALNRAEGRMSEYDKFAHERDLFRLSMEDAAIADAERVVIEAAVKEADTGECSDTLYDAVRALQKARQR